ncbi:MAG: hypothetical protein AUF67_16150 [Acidobacteria bacterium 13_1_20CM_58_21]|nr:MAG: hypothetical protein AUF67_16150 [Acidobacteria bacterium 13_1_20CM_58_21]
MRITSVGKVIVETAKPNYKAYVGALGSLPGLKLASGSDATGPTGKPLTVEEQVKEFDEAEALWQKYLTAHSSSLLTFGGAGRSHQACPLATSCKPCGIACVNLTASSTSC